MPKSAARSTEYVPLVSQTSIIEDILDDDEDDEEDELYDAASLPLMSNNECEKEIESRRKLQVYNVITLCITSLLGATAIPLQFNDIDEIWMNKDMSNLADTIFLCYVIFLATFILGALTTPLLLSFYGTKRTLVLGMAAVCALVAAHFVPSDYTLIPAYAIVGFIMNSFFTALGVAITQFGYRYAGTKIGGTNKASAILMIFHGLFQTFFLAGPLCRSLLKLLILQPQVAPPNLINNATNLHNTGQKCGVFFCSMFEYLKLNGETPSLHLIPEYGYGIFKIQAFFGSLLTLALVALLLIALCVYSPHKMDLKVEIVKKVSACKNMMKQIWTLEFALLVPLFVFIGVEQCIIYHVITKSYIECVSNTLWASYYIMCVSGCSLLASLPLAILARYLGQGVTTLLACLLQLAVLVSFLVITPDADNIAAFFVMGGLWGTADAALQTQTGVFLSVHYRGSKEYIWTQYRMWEAFGILLVFLLQHYFCIGISLLVAMTMLCATLCCYIAHMIRVKLTEQERGRQPLAEAGVVLPDVINMTWLPGLDPYAKRKRDTIGGNESRLFAADLDKLEG